RRPGHRAGSPEDRGGGRERGRAARPQGKEDEGGGGRPRRDAGGDRRGERGMIEAAVNSFRIPDLRQKIIFTAGILVIFRFITHVPVPGVDVAVLRQLFESNQLIGMLDLLSGGAMSSFSIAAMGVYPYITAQIIVQLMIPIIP